MQLPSYPTIPGPDLRTPPSEAQRIAGRIASARRWHRRRRWLRLLARLRGRPNRGRRKHVQCPSGGALKTPAQGPGFG